MPGYYTDTCEVVAHRGHSMLTKVAVCTAAFALGLVAAFQPWAGHFSTAAFVSTANTRTIVSSSQVAHYGHRSSTTMQATTEVFNEQTDAQLADSQPLATQQSSSSPTSTASVLSLSVVAGSLLGFVAAMFSKKQPQPEAVEDPEAPRRAHWAVGIAAAACMTLPQTLAPPDMMPMAVAGLPSSDPVSNPEALLRYSLPIENKEIRQVQKELEGISRQLRIPGSKPLGPINKAVGNAQSILKNDRSRKNIIAAFDPARKDEGLQALQDLQQSLEAFQGGLQDADKQAIPLYQEEALRKVGKVEEIMVKGFPFEVPAKYASLPQLRGRATVECKIRFFDNIDIEEGTITMVLDGYNAPVTAGNFYDLVSKDFYDGMKIQRADGFVVQTGNPDGKADGYVDPATGEVRIIPFEVKVNGEQEPYYEATLEDLGIYNAPVTLPFNAFGTLAMARREFVPNSSSSQIFWLLKDSELTPVGNNVLDGRYAAFGYITKNADLLKEIKVGDKIEYMKVIAGQENFIPGNPDAPPVQFDN